MIEASEVAETHVSPPGMTLYPSRGWHDTHTRNTTCCGSMPPARATRGWSRGDGGRLGDKGIGTGAQSCHQASALGAAEGVTG